MQLSFTAEILFTFFLEMYKNQFGEFICEYWGLKVK